MRVSNPGNRDGKGWGSLPSPFCVDARGSCAAMIVFDRAQERPSCFILSTVAAALDRKLCHAMVCLGVAGALDGEMHYGSIVACFGGPFLFDDELSSDVGDSDGGRSERGLGCKHCQSPGFRLIGFARRAVAQRTGFPAGAI